MNVNIDYVICSSSCYGNSWISGISVIIYDWWWSVNDVSIYVGSISVSMFYVFMYSLSEIDASISGVRIL